MSGIGIVSVINTNFSKKLFDQNNVNKTECRIDTRDTLSESDLNFLMPKNNTGCCELQTSREPGHEFDITKHLNPFNTTICTASSTHGQFNITNPNDNYYHMKIDGKFKAFDETNKLLLSIDDNYLNISKKYAETYGGIHINENETHYSVEFDGDCDDQEFFTKENKFLIIPGSIYTSITFLIQPSQNNMENNTAFWQEFNKRPAYLTFYDQINITLETIDPNQITSFFTDQYDRCLSPNTNFPPMQPSTAIAPPPTVPPFPPPKPPPLAPSTPPPHTPTPFSLIFSPSKPPLAPPPEYPSSSSPKPPPPPPPPAAPPAPPPAAPTAAAPAKPIPSSPPSPAEPSSSAPVPLPPTSPSPITPATTHTPAPSTNKPPLAPPTEYPPPAAPPAQPPTAPTEAPPAKPIPSFPPSPVVPPSPPPPALPSYSPDPKTPPTPPSTTQQNTSPPSASVQLKSPTTPPALQRPAPSPPKPTPTSPSPSPPKPTPTSPSPSNTTSNTSSHQQNNSTSNTTSNTSSHQESNSTTENQKLKIALSTIGASLLVSICGFVIYYNHKKNKVEPTDMSFSGIQTMNLAPAEQEEAAEPATEEQEEAPTQEPPPAPTQEPEQYPKQGKTKVAFVTPHTLVIGK